MKKTTKIHALEAFIKLQDAKNQANLQKTRMIEALNCCHNDEQFTHNALEALAAQRDWDKVNTAFKSLPKAKRDYAEKAHREALELGARAAALGKEYSGATTTKVTWAETASAETITSSGDQYSRRCKYRKTDAEHLVSLSVCEIVDLLDAPDLVEWSRQEGLPLIGHDAKTGACTWVVVKNKKLAVERGWVAHESGVCYHSQTSLDHAKTQLHLKLKRLKEIRNANRRERLIVRLCKNARATIQNAKELGFCDAGIRAFQSKHNIADEASLRELVATGNPQATQLAFHLAKNLKRSA